MCIRDSNRRIAFSRIRDRVAVAKLFEELGPRYQDRPGGYTRILKTRNRHGDSAPLAFIELVGRELETEEFDDYNEKATLGLEDDDQGLVDQEGNNVVAEYEAGETTEGEDSPEPRPANQ